MINASNEEKQFVLDQLAAGYPSRQAPLHSWRDGATAVKNGLSGPQKNGRWIRRRS